MTWTARALLLLLIAASLVIAGRGPSAALQNRDAIDAPASHAYPAGTDELGRDRMKRTAQALLLCLLLASAAALTATLIAAAVALAAAYANAAFSTAILLLSDSLLAVPGLFLLMLVRASLPLNMGAAATAVLTFLLIAILGWPIMVRTLAAEIRRHRSSSWMLHCKAAGLPPRTIFLRHMAVQLRPLLVTHFLLTIPAFLVAEANLGVLGLGVPEPLASWGSMLAELAESSLRGGSAWRYLPAALLIAVLLLLEFAGLDSSTQKRRAVRQPTGMRGEVLETAGR